MAVDQETDGTWTFSCERPGCGWFTSSGHATKRKASARKAEHDAEHDATED